MRFEIEVWGIGFGNWGLRFGVRCLVSGIWGLGSGVCFGFRISCFKYLVSASGAWVRTGKEEGGLGVAEVLPRSTSYFLEGALLLPRLRHRLPPTQAGFQGSGFNNYQPSIGHMLPGAKIYECGHSLIRALNENVKCPSSEGGRYHYHACCQHPGP